MRGRELDAAYDRMSAAYVELQEALAAKAPREADVLERAETLAVRLAKWRELVRAHARREVTT